MHVPLLHPSSHVLELKSNLECYFKAQQEMGWFSKGTLFFIGEVHLKR